MSNITTAWKHIEQVLQEHAPETYQALLPPASDTQIAALEQLIDRTLPSDFAESLRIHNGMRDSYGGPNRFLNYAALLSTEDIASQWQMMKDLLEGGHFEPRVDPQAPAAIKTEQVWYMGWLPFTDADGDGFILDLDPGPAGQVGQVFYFHHDSGPGGVLASSFADWLEGISKQLVEGSFTVEEGTIWLDDPEQFYGS